MKEGVRGVSPSMGNPGGLPGGRGLRGEDGLCLFSAPKAHVWMRMLPQRFPFLQTKCSSLSVLPLGCAGFTGGNSGYCDKVLTKAVAMGGSEFKEQYRVEICQNPAAAWVRVLQQPLFPHSY